MNSPEELQIGDRLEFHDPFSNDLAVGVIAEIQIPTSGSWSQVDIWITYDNPVVVAPPLPGQSLGVIATTGHFYTELFSEAPSYWHSGDPEAEGTPQDRGCYSIRKLEGEVLIQFEEAIWEITKPNLKRLMTDVANVEPGLVIHDVIKMAEYATPVVDMGDIEDIEIQFAFDFDEEFDPWEELARLNKEDEDWNDQQHRMEEHR